MIVYWIMCVILILTAFYLTYLFIKANGTNESPLGNLCAIGATILWLIVCCAIHFAINH